MWRAVVLAGLLAALAIDDTAGASSVRRCGVVAGEGITPAHVTASGTSCRMARRVADRVSKVAVAPYNGCVKPTARLRLATPCRRLGYGCKTVKRIGYEHSGIRVRCTKARATVRWDLH
jgi:hypothetical protein